MVLTRAIGLSLLLAPALAGAEPVALVLDVHGQVSPPVGLFEEIDAETELTLAPGAGVTIEHYGACQTVTVSGGAVTIGAEALDLSAAEIADRRPVDCPEVIQLSEATVNAGVVLRSIAPPKAVPPAASVQTIGLAPTILVAGGAGMDRMRIERGGREIATLPVVAGRVDWPEGGLVLTDGGRYRLVLTGGPIAYPVDVVAGRDAPGRVVLRIAPAD